VNFVFARYTICPECLGIDDHRVSPWKTQFPHKEGCTSQSLIVPNIACEDGVRLLAKAMQQS
jgi:hypothetical protein